MIKSYQAAADIPAYRFVKFTDGSVELASAGTDNIIGISEELGNTTGCVADVYIAGSFAEIEAGEAFLAGDALTSDANGKAVKATKADNIGAIAMMDANAAGDIVQVVVQLQRVITAETQEGDTQKNE